MEKRSWFFQNGLFYTILALVLLTHMILMAVRIFQERDIVSADPESSRTGPPPIKLKVLPGSISQSPAKKQIVQSQDPDEKLAPVPNRFLSDKNRTFRRQTLARKIDKFNSAGKGKGSKDISLGDLGAFDKNHDPLKAGLQKLREANRSKVARSQAGIEEGDPNQKGVSSTNDYIEGVPLGDLTYLNTTEYKYYGFFHRIRQKLEQFWGRSIQEKAAFLMKNGRRIASEENLITSLEVTLNTVGEIIGISIKGTSGVKELDDAAIESFNEAGPFPNPPKGLIENGVVKVEWGFVIKTTQNARF